MATQRVISSARSLIRQFRRNSTKLNRVPISGTWCRFKSTKSETLNNAEPVMVESADKQMIICYHPTEDFPYEHSKPIPRPDPSQPKEGVEGVLRMKFKSRSWEQDREGPSVEELSEMFYTTKHRWYPLGIRKRGLANPNPPRDRPVF